MIQLTTKIGAFFKPTFQSHFYRQELDNVEEIEATPVESAAGGKKGKKDRKKKKEAELEEAEKELEAIAAGEDPVKAGKNTYITIPV